MFFLHARAGADACQRAVREAAGDGDRRVPAPGAERPAAAGGPPAAGGDELARARSTHEFVLGPVGLGYDRGNDRLLVQLEEMLDSDLDERRRRGRAAGHRREPPIAGTSASTSRAARPTRSATVPTSWWRRADRPAVVRPSHGSRRTHVSADELSAGGVPADALTILAAGTIELVGRMPRRQQRHVPRHTSCGDDRRAWRSTSPSGASDRCGTSSPGCTAARPRPTGSAWPLGIDVVPPTVVRADAPLGEGSLQWFVNADFTEHYFSLVESRADLVDAVHGHRRVRRAGQQHRPQERALPAGGGDRSVWAIDNGLCFAAEFKLRTVIWEFAGDPLPTRLETLVRRLAERGVGDDDRRAARRRRGGGDRAARRAARRPRRASRSTAAAGATRGRWCE